MCHGFLEQESLKQDEELAKITSEGVDFNLIRKAFMMPLYDEQNRSVVRLSLSEGYVMHPDPIGKIISQWIPVRSHPDSWWFEQDVLGLAYLKGHYFPVPKPVRLENDILDRQPPEYLMKDYHA
ncbi:MAG: hypothetical protein KKE20_03465 [Nanoarchaeota archaeon]|nr:hypothetical protein [Nanoarchaeota archaeon]